MLTTPATPPSLFSGIFDPIDARALLSISPQSMVASANEGPPIPFSNAPDTTNNSFNSRRLCVAPGLADITDIVLAVTGFAFASGSAEEDFPTPYTISASVEYPLGTTPYQVFANGSTSISVTPGRSIYRFDPLTLFIPRGAQYAVKLWVNWTAPGPFWFSAYAGATVPTQEWCARGSSVANHTLDNTVLTNTAGATGFTPLIYAALSNRVPVIALLGDSIQVGATDYADNVTYSTGMSRALLTQVPYVNLGVGGSTGAQYVSRPNGRNLVLRSAITHADWEYGRNDISDGATLAQVQATLKSGIDPFLTRGVKVYVRTITPYTNSMDGWLSYTNQTPAGSFESVTMAYNAYLRANWQSLGISKLIDVALAVDPTTIGKWDWDAGQTVFPSSQIAAFFAAMSGGSIASVATFTNQSGPSWGNGYPNAATINWQAKAFPGNPGSGGSGTITVNSSGQASTGAVTSGGSGYGTQAPMIDLLGPWTAGGLHPGSRGINQIIQATGYGPSFFTF